MIGSTLRIFLPHQTAFDIFIASSFLLFSLGISFFYKKPLWSPKKKNVQEKENIKTKKK